MTEPERIPTDASRTGGATDAMPPTGQQPLTTAPPTSPWAPLRQRAFRFVWTASFVSNIGTWMQTVGAQWFLLGHQATSTMVALVQAASSLPVFLLTLPAGVLAEFVDRRRLLLGVQAFQVAVGGVLAVMTLTGRMTPSLLLAFTFVLGAGAAVQLPAYQAFVPSLVPRVELGAAASLSSLSVNLARAVGPAVAGLLVTSLGVGGLFVLNAVTFAVFALALTATPRGAHRTEASAGFLAGLEAGGRYVRNAPTVRRILARLVMFGAPANILWALLPVVAKNQLNMGAAGYGILLGAAGVGAVAGALILPRIRTHISANAILTLSGVIYGGGMVGLALTHSPAAAVAFLVPTGAAWIAVIAGLNASVQAFLPAWVRARALSIYQVVLFTTFAVSATVWGVVAQHAGLRAAFLAAGALLIAGAALGLMWPVHQSTPDQRIGVAYWPEPTAPIAPADLSAPVQVTIEYTAADRADEFVAAMSGLRRSRLRTGALSWELLQDPENPSRFVEQFEVASWEAHLEQHHTRLTADDQAFQRQVEDAASTVAPAVHLTRRTVKKRP